MADGFQMLCRASDEVNLLTLVDDERAVFMGRVLACCDMRDRFAFMLGCDGSSVRLTCACDGSIATCPLGVLSI